VLGVGRETEDVRVQRLHRVDGGRDEARGGPARRAARRYVSTRRARGHEDEARVNRGGRLAECGEDQA